MSESRRPSATELETSQPLAREIPKIVWMYWHSGVDAAPEVVRLCVESWKRLNPDWEVRVLSDASRRNWVDPESLVPRYGELPIQKRANLLRKLLLATYGGVWADATVLCVKPLSTWLPMAPAEGFLLFDNKAPDRYICNWFIGATSNSPFILEWFKRNAEYFRGKNLRPLQGFYKTVHEALRKYTTRNRRRVRFWTSWFGTTVWKTYPYYISHYLAAEILYHDKRFSGVLQRNPLLRQPFPLSVKKRMKSYKDEFSVAFLRDLEAGVAPMFKLNKLRTTPEGSAVEKCLPEIQDWIERRDRQKQWLPI